MTRPVPRQGTRLAPGELRFRFDGREYGARSGDTAASALIANGVRFLNRSVKYRRPRGLLAAGPEEPNGLLTVGRAPARVPNVCAPQLVLQNGQQLNSQNRWPTLRFDLAAVLQLGGGWFGAGFYYKTFMWPSWRSYEGIIRRLAGLGSAPASCRLGPVEIEHLHCDVLVVGTGPAGLAAAQAAQRAGARVVLCEREPAAGGELEFEDATIDRLPAVAWVQAALADIVGRGARVLFETSVVGDAGGEVIAHREPGGLPGANAIFRIRARATVYATGAIERPIAFVDNDRPGVMLLGAGERYLARYGARVGEELVLFGCHDRLYAAAIRFAAAGIRVRAIVDTRSEGQLGEGRALRDVLARAGTDCLLGHAVLAAEGARGLRAVQVAANDGCNRARRIRCDALLVSGGWSPSIGAGSRDGGQAGFGPEGGVLRVRSGSPTALVAGAANGTFELVASLADGHTAGAAAARIAGFSGTARPALEARGDGAPTLASFVRSPAASDDEKRQFVDLQNDVTVADLRAAIAEGFSDIEHAKRYTTLGIGTEQGRTSGDLGAAILAELRGDALASVGRSRARPPFQPVTLRSLAGLRVGPAFRVVRKTPLHAWHAAHGGVMEASGLWLRARYYRVDRLDAFTATVAEARRVRQGGGMLDGSTLGKFEVVGADSGAFLDSLYLSRASTIRVGRAKYMVNLREDGMVLDDGLVIRLADDRFLATTSSSHAEHMLAHFEHYRALGWGGRAVTLTDVTEAWSVIAVAGPESRARLCALLGDGWPRRVAALAHMDFADGDYRGHALRVLRASFSGELAFELHCRPAIALELWQGLYDAGLQPYGLDALDILRIEKGYLVGSELNGETTPQDLLMDGLLAQGNACLGRDLLGRPGLHEPSRPKLVGLRACTANARILAGAQLCISDTPTRPVGYVTSAAYSPTLGAWVGLALLGRNVAALDSTLDARDPLRGADVRVRVVSPVHLDPAGERMKS
jgi:methylglutamate dehydrogenase subunit C